MAPKKSSDGPKRPLSAYLLWLKDNREKIKQPGMSVAEVTKLAGPMWKNIDDVEKSKYQKMADAEKARYKQAIASHGDN